MTKVAFAQATYSKDFEETKLCIERVSPHVDCTIISHDNSLNEEQIKWLNNNSEKYHIYPVIYDWEDNMPEMRNSYLNKAKELKVDWICVSDPDELYSEELSQNLKNIIEKYDNMNYGMLGVHAKDQFECFNWLDSLDLLKECPAGYNETDFWKPILILKLYPDLEYQGIGKEKNVHETVVTKERFKTLNLEKKYYYVHKKNALKIWRNAARNMFISGGGDNVGSSNILWRSPIINLTNQFETENFELENLLDDSIIGIRDICDKLKINEWNDFEHFIVIGQEKYLENKEKEIINDNTLDEVEKFEKLEIIKDTLQLFDQWLVNALQAGSNNYQTETRETVKWYFALHRDEIDDFILNLIENPPKTKPVTEIENFVSKMYFSVLGRHPDMSGKQSYVKAIESGRMKKEDLETEFRNSNEYKTKFPFGREKISNESKTKDDILNKNINKNINKSVNVEIDILNDLEIENYINNIYLKTLGRSVDDEGKDVYKKHIKSGKINFSQLENVLKNSSEYKEKLKLYESKSNIQYNVTLKTDNILHNKLTENIKIESSPFERQERKTVKSCNVTLDLDRIDVSKYNTVALCIMGYANGLEHIIENIKTIGKYVDEIHVQADDFGINEIDKLNKIGNEIDKDINIHIVKWNDDFSEYKNKACRWASTEWILICDHDEVPTEDMAKRLKEIILKSDRGNNFDMVSFDVIDIILDKNNGNKIIHENRNRSGKAILHWRVPNPYTGDVHIWLNDYYPWKTIHAPVAYKHIKNTDEILERSARNIWMGGGGDTVKEKNELWTELQEISKELGLLTWNHFNNYMKKGNVDVRVYDIFEKLSKKPWKDTELMDMMKYYLKLHPEESIRKLVTI